MKTATHNGGTGMREMFEEAARQALEDSKWAKAKGLHRAAEACMIKYMSMKRHASQYERVR